MGNFKCKECDKTYDNIKSLSMHRSRQHNIKSKLTYDEYILNNIIPSCKCGCGEYVNFLSIDKGYREFIRGHASRVNNNWGHNSDVLKKSHDTQKKMYESGELTIWNKGLSADDSRVKKYGESISNNKERGKKISNSLSGVKKSEEHKKNISEGSKIRWANPEEREKQSHKRMLWMKENDYTVKSKIEEIINVIFITLGLKENIDYERQSYVRDIKSYYDFKLFKNNIYIEIDGDFWHCNPKTKHKVPIYESQFKNLKKDIIKNKWCEDNNYNIIRFWEYDINNNLEEVIIRLKELVK